MLRFFVACCFITISARAQWGHFNEYNFNLKFHEGFIVKHNSAVAHLATQHPKVLEIDMYRQTNGSQAWHQVHHFPSIGYSFNYVFLDPSRPVGNMSSLVVYMSKALFKTDKHKLEVRVGMGPGYAERVFDVHSNYKNNITSSKFVFCLNGRINYSLNIGKYLNLNTGIGIIHFSNGGIKLPNQGINIPSIHLGIGFQKDKTKLSIRDTLPAFKRSTHLDMMYAFGFKEEYPVNGPKFFTSTLSAYLNRRLNRKSGLTLGIDFFYDASLERYFNDPQLPFFKKTRAGITIGHELFFGKLSLLTQLGFYVYDPFKLNAALYERYGFKYQLYKSMFAQLTMKSHFGAVDYVEWGVGIRL